MMIIPYWMGSRKTQTPHSDPANVGRRTTGCGAVPGMWNESSEESATVGKQFTRYPIKCLVMMVHITIEINYHDGWLSIVAGCQLWSSTWALHLSARGEPPPGRVLKKRSGGSVLQGTLRLLKYWRIQRASSPCAVAPLLKLNYVELKLKLA